MRLLIFLFLLVPCASFASNDDTLSARLMLDTSASEVYCIADSTGDIAHNTIRFSEPTEYKIYDQYGNIVSQGNGTQVTVAALSKGGYFLVIKRRTFEFRRM